LSFVVLSFKAILEPLPIVLNGMNGKILVSHLVLEEADQQGAHVSSTNAQDKDVGHNRANRISGGIRALDVALNHEVTD
jgi:hypothetical protein